MTDENRKDEDLLIFENDKSKYFVIERLKTIYKLDAIPIEVFNEIYNRLKRWMLLNSDNIYGDNFINVSNLEEKIDMLVLEYKQKMKEQFDE